MHVSHGDGLTSLAKPDLVVGKEKLSDVVVRSKTDRQAVLDAPHPFIETETPSPLHGGKGGAA